MWLPRSRLDKYQRRFNETIEPTIDCFALLSLLVVLDDYIEYRPSSSSLKRLARDFVSVSQFLITTTDSMD